MPAFYPQLGGAMPNQPKGPFGGAVAMKGQGGYQQAPQPAVAPTPQPAPAPVPAPSQAPPPQQIQLPPRAMPQRPVIGASNPYGPVTPRAENAPDRMAVRRMANAMMLRRQ